MRIVRTETMIFQTESQSVYEVNTDSKQIRRLDGIHDPLPRQGKDGEWKSYWAISPIKLNHSVVIAWEDTVPGSSKPDEHRVRSTMTSLVVKIIPTHV